MSGCICTLLAVDCKDFEVPKGSQRAWLAAEWKIFRTKVAHVTPNPSQSRFAEPSFSIARKF
jgi:hypothetical protein